MTLINMPNIEKYIEKFMEENNTMLSTGNIAFTTSTPHSNLIISTTVPDVISGPLDLSKWCQSDATNNDTAKLPFSICLLLEGIKNYEIYNDKALVVWFKDGTFTKAVVDDGEEFNLYTGLMVCLFKKYLGKDGSKAFNKMMRTAMKKLDAIDDRREKETEERARLEKKRRKAIMKKKAKQLKAKEEAIDIQKQGYIRAMQEIGMTGCTCSGGKDDIV